MKNSYFYISYVESQSSRLMMIQVASKVCWFNALHRSHPHVGPVAASDKFINFSHPNLVGGAITILKNMSS
jgi:hypothetical protein